MRIRRFASGGTNGVIPSTRSRNCWPRDSESGLELGHTDAEGPAIVDRLLLVRDPGHLQAARSVDRMVADCESSGLAKKLIRGSCDKHRIEQ